MSQRAPFCSTDRRNVNGFSLTIRVLSSSFPSVAACAGRVKLRELLSLSILGTCYKRARSRGHPERRDKNRALWTWEGWGLFLANLYAPPRADPPPYGSHRRYSRIWMLFIYSCYPTSSGRSTITMTMLSQAPLLPAYSRLVPGIIGALETNTGPFAGHCLNGALSLQARASRIWALPKTSLRSSGTPSGTNGGTGRTNGCRRPVWRLSIMKGDSMLTSPHNLYWPISRAYQEGPSFSMKSASAQLPQEPQRQLITTFLDIATHCAPLLLWTACSPNISGRCSIRTFNVFRDHVVGHFSQVRVVVSPVLPALYGKQKACLCAADPATSLPTMLGAGGPVAAGYSFGPLGP